MIKIKYLNIIITALVLTLGITVYAEAKRANLKRLKTNKAGELRQNWKDYTVYKRARPSSSFQRGFVAFVYKLKDDKKIILDKQWVEVTSDEMKAKAKILDSTISAEILGHNKELYGYLVYRADDIVSVKIIDEQSVRLNYRYNRNYTN